MAELCWAFSLIFVGNDPSFTAEGGGAKPGQHYLLDRFEWRTNIAFGLAARISVAERPFQLSACSNYEWLRYAIRCPPQQRAISHKHEHS